MNRVATPGYLRFPHIHGDLLTFVAEDDVWLAPAVGGQPPGAAAVGGGEPDVVFGDKGQQVTVNVREAKITGSCHAVHLMGGNPLPAMVSCLPQSQPRSSAMRRASVRLRAPVFWMQEER